MNLTQTRPTAPAILRYKAFYYAFFFFFWRERGAASLLPRRRYIQRSCVLVSCMTVVLFKKQRETGPLAEPNRDLVTGANTIQAVKVTGRDQRWQDVVASVRGHGQQRIVGGR